MGFTNPCQAAPLEYAASRKMSSPLSDRIKSQTHAPPDDMETNAALQAMRTDKGDQLREKCEEVKSSLPEKTARAVDLATQKGASTWLTVLPIKEMNFDLHKREFRDAVKLRYDWQI